MGGFSVSLTIHSRLKDNWAQFLTATVDIMKHFSGFLIYDNYIWLK